MKFKNKFMYVMAMVLCLIGLSGCGSKKVPQMANELHFPAGDISDLTISYDEEKIVFFEGDNDDLIIREYMTANKKSYHAKVEQRDTSIKITEGGKPFGGSSFIRYIEVYLPTSYKGNLTVSTTDGSINLSEMELGLSTLRIDSTSGKIDLKSAEAQVIHISSTKGTLRIGSLKADHIRLETTSGNTVCEKLDGDVTYTSARGDARIEAAVGGGSYKANNSGKLEVTYVEVTDDLSLFNKNGNVSLTLPEVLAFDFQATTKNGSVSTNFQESVTVDGQTTKGPVGSQPTVTVEVETRNGDIEVIGLFTKKQYDHISLSFDEELYTVISYNGRELG